jgi:RNA polymerase sigma-70 factor (ECF subfamily)
MTDIEIVSLTAFWERNYHSLVTFVRGRLDDAAHMDGEDIVQDVVLKLLDRPELIRPVKDLTGYIFRALRNRIVDEYRKPCFQTMSLDEERLNNLSLHDIIPDMSYEPEDSYAKEQMRNQIYEAIDSLPLDQKLVIIETEFNGISFRELGKRLQTPVGTLLARKHRGLKTIHRELKHIHSREENNACIQH